MSRSVFQQIKINGFWIAVLLMIFVPQIRQPLSVWINRGFSFINWVSIEEKKEFVNLEELVLINEEGNIVKGETLKERVVFINFWATWCPPCIAEMPSIQKLYTDYGEEIEFLMISDEPKERILSFMSKESYNFKVYQPKAVPIKMYSSTIPQTLIIGADGSIVVNKTGAVNWNSKEIRSILEGLLKTSI